MVWDNEKEKLHGPFLRRNPFNQPRLDNKILLVNGSRVGFPENGSDENTLDGYKFTDISEIELYLYFRDVGLSLDFCISGFDKEKLILEEV